MDAFFSIPINAFTDTEQQVVENKWQVYKYRQDTLEHVETILVSVIKCAIDKAYHMGSMSMGVTVFGTLTTPQIILCMQHNYGRPGIMEVKKSLLQINDPMGCNMLTEVMLRGMEEVQMFLLVIPEDKRELTEFNLIYHALIKLSETGGLYTKAL